MRTIPSILLGALLGATASCKRPADAKADPEWWRLEGARVDLAQRLELLQLRIAKADSRAGEIEKIREETAVAASRSAELEIRAKGLRAGIEDLTAELEQRREAWVQRVRSDATGMRFDVFSGRGGRSYEDVLITRVSDIGIEFRHKSGSARLAAEDMDSKQLELFGIDLRQAENAREKERAAALTYQASVDRIVAAQEVAEKEKAAERALSQAAARRDLALQRSQQATAMASVETRSRLDERPKRVRDSSFYYGPAIHYGSRWSYQPAYGRTYRDIKTWGLPSRTPNPPSVVCPPPGNRARLPITPHSPTYP